MTLTIWMSVEKTVGDKTISYDIDIEGVKCPEWLPPAYDTDAGETEFHALERIMETMGQSLRDMMPQADPEPETEPDSCKVGDIGSINVVPAENVMHNHSNLFHCKYCGKVPQRWDQQRVKCITQNCPVFGAMCFNDEWNKIHEPADPTGMLTAMADEGIKQLCRSILIEHVRCEECPAETLCNKSGASGSCNDAKMAWLDKKLAGE